MTRIVTAALRCAPVSLLVLALLPAATGAGPAGGTWQGDAQAIAEVRAAYQKFLAARTYRMRMASTAQGQTFVQTMEIVSPDRMRMSGGPGAQGTEFTFIGSDSWVRGPAPGVPGGCTKLPSAGRRPNPREGVDHTDDARITVARGGPETVEGTATMSYNLTIETQGRQFRQKLYVATATGYPRRLEMSSDQGTVTIDYFDFDAPITINPPC